MRAPLWIAAAATLALGGCAYYNALYNAHRAFDEARRAAADGQTGAAQAAYGVAVEKARRSLERDPDGRWADDAHLIIGRAQFERGNLADARAALQQAIARAGDRETRGLARAFLGATELRLGDSRLALPHLDAAVEDLQGTGHAAVAHLWRARARFALEDVAGAWSDIDAAAAADGPLAVEAAIESAAQGVRLGERDRAAAAFATLLRETAARPWLDSIHSLARAASGRWGAASARAMTAAAGEAPWPGPARDSVALFRAELAHAAGDTATARAEAEALASEASRQVADRARVALARWRLASAVSLEELARIRTTLLPAVADAEAVRLLRGVKVVETLAAQAERNGQALALFAAGEMARDRLGAPALARRFFIAYADVVPDALWAPKALLAAAALADDAEEHARIRRRLLDGASSVYLVAASGRDPGADYVRAEERLQRTLAALIGTATADAERRDALVEGAVASLDSIRAVARTDSLKLACGGMLDSLAVTGVLADSIQAACMRGAIARIDTLLIRQDSIQKDPALRGGQRPNPAGRRKILPDTAL